MRSFYQPMALGDPCGSKTSKPTESHTDGAATVKTGGPSEGFAERKTSPVATADSAALVVQSEKEPVAWRLDGKPVLGHRVVRSAVAESLDLHIVLSAGDAEDHGPVSFEIPESILRWLLTGEQ